MAVTDAVTGVQRKFRTTGGEVKPLLLVKAFCDG
jgi:hypothetical protein